MAVDRDTPRGIVTLFTAVSDYASRQGFVGGVPNLHEADYGDGRGVVYGSFLFKQQGAKWRDIPARDIGGVTNRDTAVGIRKRINAVGDYASQIGFVGGVPNLHEADYGDGRGVVYGSFLFKQQGAEWRDIPARELGLEEPPPPAQGDDMQPGEVLNADQSIWSANGRFRFIYQLDGNLVLYGPRMPLWASGTTGRTPRVCIMQGDGNLVIYGPGGVYIWDTKTHNNPGSRLIVQDDGNVVIYKPDGRPIWATNTETVRLGYETGDISSGWEWGKSQGCHLPPPRRCPTDPLVTVNSPVREGNFALKATIKAGDTDIEGRARAEVLTSSKYADFSQASVVHYHWYTMFPTRRRFQLKTDGKFGHNGTSQITVPAVNLIYNLYKTMRGLDSGCTEIVTIPIFYGRSL
ncbi:MAG TPA: heparin lyase I family protein [Nitrososphaeraceae archaeon]|nr:heparin lyase I family protein [Nitrososphaeraceae archaeon]